MNCWSDGEARKTQARVPVALALLAFVSLALLPGCSRGNTAAGPTPQQRLQTAESRTQALSSFHFLLTHEHGSSSIALGLQMTRAEGDFQKPDRFRATVNAVFAGLPVSVNVINVGDSTWITNPLQTSQQYQPLPNGTQATTILDPDSGVLKAAGELQNATDAGSAKIAGVDTRIIQGKLDATALSSLATDAQQGYTVSARIWIGIRDSLIYRIRLEGPLSNSEPQNIVRQLETSQFNEKIDIQPPS